MKIYIVTQAQPARLHTPKLLQAAGVPFTLVVDNTQQANAAKALGYSQSLVAPSTGLPSKRNFITQHHKQGWYIGMDDNIQSFTAVAQPWRDQPNVDTTDTAAQPWRKLFNQTCPVHEYLDELEDLRAHCLEADAHYAGVATMENPFFRGKRFGLRRFVKSKLFIMDAAAGITFKHRMCHDSYASALSVAMYGQNLVDNHLFYKAAWYEAGGLGSRAARDAAGLGAQLQLTIDEFPGLVGLARGKNSALRFNLTSDTAVNRWRANHGWLKEGAV